MTAVEYLIQHLTAIGELNIPDGYNIVTDIVRQALEKEQEDKIDIIIKFQLFMHEHGFISNHLWDYEDMAIKFLNSKKNNL